eukprot:TRINITY_DN1134_c7_g2_i1.p1 TRINITY_DN1134_c7_g2~~TRINITY_DN1134_c7_g2_i1.p1  ORF type:complete len:497 (+),score=116.01 TRINITY_DN1134_c7_g2_i1:103-1593(+)
MVKFDASLLRYLDEEDFRVLAAVELASRNHEIAPTGLVERIAGLKAGGAKKRLRWLLKHNFLLHDNKIYDGFRMNYQAYDYLALRAFVKRNSCIAVGNKIGVGKESDIYVVMNEEEEELILKIQRLGRTSFRSIKKNRDYKNGRALHGESWYYLSRLAAAKEFSFMKALHAEGFPVPTPIDQNRHCIVMSRVNGVPLINVAELEHPQRVFKDCIDLIIKFAQYGLIHGDFNEFNLMITDDEEVVVIDFPQMTSTNHPNAQYLFDRDVQCIHDYFRRKFKVEFDYYPTLHVDTERQQSLDKQVLATGYNKQNEKELSNLSNLLNDDNSDSDSETDSDSDSDSDSETEDKENATETILPDTVLKELSVSINVPENPDGHDEEDDAEPLLDASEDEKPKYTKEEKAAYKAKKKGTDGASTTASMRIRRKANPNYSVSESGCTEINMDHVKNRVKGNLKREEIREIARTCKRNTQKPSDKRRTKRDIVGTRRDLRAEGMI